MALRGRRVAIGPRGSGTEQLARDLLAHFRIEPHELTLVNMAHMEAAEALAARGASLSRRSSTALDRR